MNLPGKKTNFKFLAAALLATLILAPGLKAAQETDLLIREDKPAGTVRRRAPNATPKPKADAVDPTTIVAGIVNRHSITKAALSGRLQARYEAVKKDVLRTQGGVVSTLDPTGKVVQAAADAEMLEEQERALINALAREEGELLVEWVEQNLLADEAIRQGIIISEAEFRTRLREAEAANDVNAELLGAVLKQADMTRADYERQVYDAIRIEKLLDRYASLNYKDADLKAAYEANPHFYREPPRKRLAHFSVALDGLEERAVLALMRRKANEVRDALRKDANPAELFARDEFNQMGMGILGSAPGWFDMTNTKLPPAVDAAAKKLKTGEVSDVITQQRLTSDGKSLPDSFHVLKVLEESPATGNTYESALPRLRKALLMRSRFEVLKLLRTSGTHRLMTNLGGIPARRLPTQEQLLILDAQAAPINLALSPEERALVAFDPAEAAAAPY